MKAKSWFALLPILLLGAYLRFHHLATFPSWYPDEGSNIAVAASLARGELAYLAFGQSSFINPHPHLFYLPLAGLFRLAGVDILWARLLSASCGFLTLILLYPVVRALVDPRVALLATFFYAIYPAAILYSRFAFTYNLLTPLYLLGLYALHRYLDSDRLIWLFLAALCAGLAPVTDLIGIILPLFLALALLLHRPRHLLVALPLFVLPPLAWGIWMWKVGGEAFLFDTAFAFTRVSASLPLQLARLIFFYRQGLEYDLWFALGNFGLLLLPHRRSRWLIGGFYFVSLFVLLRTVDTAGLGYYYAMPLFPFIAVGVALPLAYGLPYLLKRLQGDILHLLAGSFLSLRWRRLLAFYLNASIVFLIIVSLFTSIVFEALFPHYGSFTDRLDLMDVLADPETARLATSYVNSRTSPDDLVLCSPTIAWLLHAQAADFQMAIAATGRATQHFPAGIPPSRFRFDPRLENATYVILDPFWRGWASAQMPEVAQIVREVEEGWVLERRFGKFEVYRYPPGGKR
jgi:4-amino-4-deoxy-L-arabinose transferase-like glycosyltransferase